MPLYRSFSAVIEDRKFKVRWAACGEAGPVLPTACRCLLLPLPAVTGAPPHSLDTLLQQTLNLEQGGEMTCSLSNQIMAQLQQ